MGTRGRIASGLTGTTNILIVLEASPPHPATIEGRPLIEYHEQHPLLEACGQFIPGGDGEEFDPPLKFGALLLDQSYVIAEKFEILHLTP